MYVQNQRILHIMTMLSECMIKSECCILISQFAGLKHRYRGFKRVCSGQTPAVHQPHPQLYVYWQHIIQTVFSQVFYNLPSDQSVHLFVKTYLILDITGLYLA